MGVNLVPQGSDVRNLLRGYGFDLTVTLTLTAGTVTQNSAVVSGINTLGLFPNMIVSGPGIQPGTFISAINVIDPVNGQITLDVIAMANGSNVSLVFTYYPACGDDWLANERDNFIIPWITRVTRQVFTSIETVTEYYDGTGGSILALRRRPIQQLLAIWYTNVDSNLYYLTPSAIQVVAEEGLLKAKANFNESTYIPIFYRGERNVVVQYTVGYAQMPNDVYQAVTCLMAERALAHQASKTGGGSGLGTQGYSRSFGDRGKYGNRRLELKNEAMAILNQYTTRSGA